MEKKLLSVKELAEYIGLAIGTIYHMVAAREIPYYKIRKSVKFSVAEIDDWIKKKKVSSSIDF